MIGLARFVTDFADAGLVIPLAAAIAVTLLLLGRLRLAVIWSAVSITVWLTMLLLKMAGYTMAQVAPVVQEQTGLMTASGHTADAACTYGALAALLMGPAQSMVRRSWLTALGVAVLIGITRVILRDHTLAEAVVGGAVGIAGAGVFAALTREALHGGRRAALVAATAATIILLHGQHFSLEQTIALASARALQTWRAE